MDVCRLVDAGDDPGQVAEEEHDDGGDQNDGEVAISRLLGCSPLSKFVCGRVAVTVAGGLPQLQSATKASQARENSQVEEDQNDEGDQSCEDNPCPSVVVDDVFFLQP